MSKFENLKEARSSEEVFDYESIDQILKQFSVIETGIKELKQRAKSEDEKACMQILKKINRTVEDFESNVRGMVNTGGYYRA